MNRRTALKNLLLMLAAGAGALRPRSERFYVAGARFFPSQERLRAGDSVALVSTTVRGARAIAVETLDGARIGWVPRALIARMDAAGARRATLSEVSLHRVPWRWYRLTAG